MAMVHIAWEFDNVIFGDVKERITSHFWIIGVGGPSHTEYIDCKGRY